MKIKEWLFGRKYFVAFLMKQNDTYVLVDKIRVSEGKDKIKYNDKSYPILFENPTYINKREVIYLMDINGGQLHFGKNEDLDSSYFELINSICDKRIVNDLTQDLIEKPSLTDKLMFIATGIGVGLFIGIIVGQILVGVL